MALSHPTYRRVVQAGWGLLILVNIVLFGVGLVDYANSLRQGCLCLSLSMLDVQDGRVVLSPNPTSSAAGLIQDGDFLLAIDRKSTRLNSSH